GGLGDRRDAAVANWSLDWRHDCRALRTRADLGNFCPFRIGAVGSGKVVPSGRVKLIQPFETGVVRAIHVRDGQSVKAGDVLIELDPTMTAAEQEHIRSDLIAAQLDAARLRAALNDSDNPENLFQPPAGASPDLVAMQRQFLAEQTKEYRAKLASLDSQRTQKQAESGTVAAAVYKLEATIPIIQQRADIQKFLNDKGLSSKLTYLETLQLLTEHEKELAVQKSRLDEANAAPVDGVIQQLTVHTVGGVVTPAQQLAVVVPSDAVLEVDAMVSNRDIGFIH